MVPPAAWVPRMLTTLWLLLFKPEFTGNTSLVLHSSQTTPKLHTYNWKTRVHELSSVIWGKHHNPVLTCVHAQSWSTYAILLDTFKKKVLPSIYLWKIDTSSKARESEQHNFWQGTLLTDHPHRIRNRKHATRHKMLGRTVSHSF